MSCWPRASSPSNNRSRGGPASRLWRAVLLGSIAVLLGPAAMVRAQDEATTTLEAEGSAVETAGGNLSRQPGNLPSDAFRNDPAVGVRYRDLFRSSTTPFRDTEQVYMSSPVTGNANADLGYTGPVTAFRGGAYLRSPVPLEGSESISTSFDLMGLRLGYSLTGSQGFNLLGRGFEPQDADLKVGPLFFKMHTLGAAVLMSDNINASEDDRESGAISIAYLSGTLVAQLTETLRISATGTLYWLPFKGKVGITTDSGIYDFGLGGSNFQTPVAQIDWEGRVGQWDVFLSDSFRVNMTGGPFSDYNYGQSLFEGSSFDEFDQAGRYRYGGYDTSGRRLDDRDLDGVSDNRDLDVYSYSNRLDVGAQRLYPGPMRIRLRAYREDLWYNQGGRGLPSLREGASAYASYERENLRFKPYALYEITRNDLDPEWDQYIRVGLRGPITDQLTLNLFAGEFLDGATDRTHFTAGMQLRHVAGPFTYESLFVGREIDDYYAHDEIVDRVTYDIHQILGPRLFADAFASYEKTRSLEEENLERESFLAGIRLTWLYSPKTHLRLGYTYQERTAGNSSFLFSGEEDRFDDANVSNADYFSHTVRLQIFYRITDTMRTTFDYEFFDVHSNVGGRSYYENRVILSLSKYFY